MCAQGLVLNQEPQVHLPRLAGDSSSLPASAPAGDRMIWGQLFTSVPLTNESTPSLTQRAWPPSKAKAGSPLPPARLSLQPSIWEVPLC